MERRKNTLTEYTEKMLKSPRLSSEEEKKLSYQALKGDKSAIKSLVTLNQRFVISMARKYKDCGIEMEDLISEGNIALLKAASHYDAERGARFVSYATPIVKRSMERLISKKIKTEKRDKNDERNRKKIEQKVMLSVDAPLGWRENHTLLSVLMDTSQTPPDDKLFEKDIADKVHLLANNLEGRQKEVIEKILSGGKNPPTLAQIGEQMGLKRERVRQIRNQALRNMRRMMK